MKPEEKDRAAFESWWIQDENHYLHGAAVRADCWAAFQAALKYAPEQAEPVYCVLADITLRGTRIYEHHSRPVPNVDYITLYTTPPQEMEDEK